jgi:hypothetical protein
MTTLEPSPVATHAVLSASRDVALDCIGANDAQRHLFANQTPERDCFLDDFHVIHRTLRERGVDADHMLAGFVTRLRQVIQLNDHELHGERALAGTLDQLASAEHAAQRTTDVPSALGVRRLAQELRGPLNAWGSATSPAELWAAFRTLDEVIRSVPMDRLIQGSLRAQLGEGPHNKLLALIGADTVA